MTAAVRQLLDTFHALSPSEKHEAAVELLILPFGGRFAAPSLPWVCMDRGRVWLDADQIHPQIGHQRQFVTRLHPDGMGMRFFLPGWIGPAALVLNKFAGRP